MVTSLLSLIGAALIIIFHQIIIEGSNTSRLILTHLSIANFFATSWNWIGLWFNYKHFPGPSSDFCGFCVAQASFSNIGINSSTFWTISLIMHYYLLLACQRSHTVPSVIYSYFFTCWMISLLLSGWLLFDHWLGYRAGLSIPYCTIRLDDNGNSSRNGLGVLLGNDCWTALCIISVLLFYLGIQYEKFRTVSSQTT